MFAWLRTQHPFPEPWYIMIGKCMFDAWHFHDTHMRGFSHGMRGIQAIQEATPVFSSAAAADEIDDPFALDGQLVMAGNMPSAIKKKEACKVFQHERVNAGKEQGRRVSPVGKTAHQTSLRIEVGDRVEEGFEHCLITASDQGVVIVCTDQQAVEYLGRIQILFEERHGHCNKILIFR